MSWFLPSKSKFAFEQTTAQIKPTNKGDAFLWTFTFPTVLDVKVARERWSRFLRRMREAARRKGIDFSGIRVFEMHPGGHGLHIHVLTGQFWWVRAIRRIWEMNGGGRVHVKPIPFERRNYLGKYLSKQGRPPALRGARMWQAFGGQPSCKVKDVVIDSLWRRVYDGLTGAYRAFRTLRWYEKLKAVNNVLTFRSWHWGLFLRGSDTEPQKESYEVQRLFAYAESQGLTLD